MDKMYMFTLLTLDRFEGCPFPSTNNGNNLGSSFQGRKNFYVYLVYKNNI